MKVKHTHTHKRQMKIVNGIESPDKNLYFLLRFLERLLEPNSMLWDQIRERKMKRNDDER